MVMVGHPLALSFNSSLIMLGQVHESPYPVLPFFIPAKSASHQLLQRWVESLPRVVWELDAKDELATGVIFDFLLWLQQRDTKLFDAAALDNVAARLHPFFHLDHPSRGAMPGPWTRLKSESLRKLALDVAYTWTARGENKLCEAVNKAVCHLGFQAERAHWEGLNRVL
jgi:pre-rRNA-processing protein IPI1